MAVSSGNLAGASLPPVAPEPVSTTLFLIGGAALGARRFLRKSTK